MRILFVASRFPRPMLHGDAVRSYHQIRLLAARHEVTLLTPADPAAAATEIDALGTLRRIEPVPVPRWRRVVSLASAPFTMLPLQTLYFYHAEMRRRAERLLAETSYDLLHVQMIRMAPLAAEWHPVPRVIDLIDCLSLSWSRWAAKQPGPLGRALAWEVRRIRSYEQALLRSYDQVLVSSAVDGAALGDHPNLHVVPNGVPLDAFPFVREGRDEATIVMTGRMGYFPNADGAHWFAREVFPRVARAIPGARFLVVGADPPARLRRLASRSVQVTGFVKSIQEHLTRATAAVCPMRSGAGTQNKMLEAMAAGTPVVTTPTAAGGLAVRQEEHVLIADGAEQFAACVVRLLRDASLRDRLAANARSLVEERYSWPQSVARLEAVYDLAARMSGHDAAARPVLASRVMRTGRTE